MKDSINLIHGDCLEVMDTLIDINIKVDAIITDPPYGTTSCKWDTIIPFDEMWRRLKLLRKETTPVILFGSEPFSSALRMSNIKEYKYDWVWNKKLAGNGILAKRQPLKIHELISIFYKHNYCPEMTIGRMRNKLTSSPLISEINGGDGIKRCKQTRNNLYYPKSIVDFSLANLRKGRIHPTQKPIELLEYLIKTYTKENDLILDFTCGSGSTIIAARNLNRKVIGIDNGYCEKDKIINEVQIKDLSWIDITKLRLEGKLP